MVDHSAPNISSCFTQENERDLLVKKEQRFKDPLCNSDSADKNYKKLNTQHYCFSRMESIALETVPSFCTTDHRFSVTLWCKLIDGALYSGTQWGFSQTNTSGLSSDLLRCLSGQYL